MRKRQTEPEKARSLEVAFTQLGWQISSESATAQTAPQILNSDIPYAPDVFGHDSPTYPPEPDTGAAAVDAGTTASPPHHSVRRKGTRKANNASSASTPTSKKTRGLVTGKKVAKMCRTTGDRIDLRYDEFTQGVSGRELSSLTATQIGKIVRGSVRMMAPNWESLPEQERFKVIHELSVHFNMEQRAEMLKAINTSAGDVYRRWKHELHKYYVQHDHDSVPDEFLQTKDEWNWLVGRFDSPEYQRRSTANKNNRDKKVYHHG